MTLLIQTAKKFEESVRNFEKVLIRITTFIMLLLMFLASADVIGRYIFNNPIFGAMEIEKILLGSIIFFGWAYTQSQDDHISVDILFIHYPARVKAIVSLITLFLSLFLFVIITWRAIIEAIEEWHSGVLVQLIHVPSAPFKLLLILGGMLLCFEIIIQLTHLVSEIFCRKDS